MVVLWSCLIWRVVMFVVQVRVSFWQQCVWFWVRDHRGRGSRRAWVFCFGDVRILWSSCCYCRLDLVKLNCDCVCVFFTLMRWWWEGKVIGFMFFGLLSIWGVIILWCSLMVNRCGWRRSSRWELIWVGSYFWVCFLIFRGEVIMLLFWRGFSRWLVWVWIRLVGFLSGFILWIWGDGLTRVLGLCRRRCVLSSSCLWGVSIVFVIVFWGVDCGGWFWRWSSRRLSGWSCLGL